MKSNPARYCPHCEEKMADKRYHPYCSEWCREHAK